MPTHVRLWRNTALMVPVMTIWLFIYTAVLFALERSALVSAALFILVLLVAIGLLPGSYLQSLVDRGAVMAPKAKPPIVIAVSLAFPALLLVLGALGASMEWASLQFDREFGFATVSDVVLLSFLAAMAATGALFLAVNTVTVVRIARSGKQDHS